jgi:hypothetical protein
VNGWPGFGYMNSFVFLLCKKNIDSLRYFFRQNFFGSLIVNGGLSNRNITFRFERVSSVRDFFLWIVKNARFFAHFSLVDFPDLHPFLYFVKMSFFCVWSMSNVFQTQSSASFVFCMKAKRNSWIWLVS